MKKKIALIGYGGTITMIVDEKSKKIIPAKNIAELLSSVPRLSEIADIDMHILSDVDSTNVVPEDWTKIAYFIADHRDEYDGFVITHGTNTMAYTASGLELALGEGLDKPVILTGSQLSLTVYGNDARFNLENAVKTAVKAAEEEVYEVMIVFSDVIIRGARAVKISESSFKAFMSPAYPPIGHILSTGIFFNSAAKQGKPTVKFKLQPHFEKGVLTVELSPGQSPALIEEVIKSGRCKGLILKSHGAGSVPTLGEFSFLPLIERTVSHYKVPVIVATKFLGGNSYKEVNDAPAVEAIDAGAITSKDMTDVMTEVKLMWLLAQGNKDIEGIRQGMWQNFAGEIS